MAFYCFSQFFQRFGFDSIARYNGVVGCFHWAKCFANLRLIVAIVIAFVANIVFSFSSKSLALISPVELVVKINPISLSCLVVFILVAIYFNYLTAQKGIMPLLIVDLATHDCLNLPKSTFISSKNAFSVSFIIAASSNL